MSNHSALIPQPALFGPSFEVPRALQLFLFLGKQT